MSGGGLAGISRASLERADPLASEGEKRYGDLATLLPGVSPKVLSERLDNLVARGLVLRRPVFRFPRGVGYGLTPKATELIAILDQLEVWSRQDDHGAPG